MWSVFLQRIGGQYAAYLTFPVAFIIGSIGYYVEKQYCSEPRAEIPYLEKALSEQRMNRQLKEEFWPDFQHFSRFEEIANEKTKIVPQTLSINSGRSS